MALWLVPENQLSGAGLWDQLDLTLLEGMGWQLDGVKVQDAVTLDGGKTFLGVVQQHMSQASDRQLVASDSIFVTWKPSAESE